MANIHNLIQYSLIEFNSMEYIGFSYLLLAIHLGKLETTVNTKLSRLHLQIISFIKEK